MTIGIFNHNIHWRFDNCYDKSSNSPELSKSKCLEIREH